jgi:hypothetical protein
LGQGRITVVREGREIAFGEGDRLEMAQFGPFHPVDLLPQLPQPVVDEALAALDETTDAAPDEVLALANERQLARVRREWAKADQLRNKIEALGWQVQDTLDGPALTPGANSR